MPDRAKPIGWPLARPPAPLFGDRFFRAGSSGLRAQPPKPHRRPASTSRPAAAATDRGRPYTKAERRDNGINRAL